MARKWDEKEIGVEELREVIAMLSIAARRLEAVISGMTDDGRKSLLMENVISLNKAAKAAMSSANKASDALAMARQRDRLVSEFKAKEEEKAKSRKKG